MANIYDILKQKYNLNESYEKLSAEEEKRLIKLYQNPKTPNYQKQAIVEKFWDMNKSRVAKEAIFQYSSLLKQCSGNVLLEIDDFMNKGARAIAFCLDKYGKIEQKKNETKAEFLKRKKKSESARFGTLLQWWIRPFITEKMMKENHVIYKPHSKTSKVKSVVVESLDKPIDTENKKTSADLIADDKPTPDEYARKSFFWDTITGILKNKYVHFGPKNYLTKQEIIFNKQIKKDKTLSEEEKQAKYILPHSKIKQIDFLRDWYLNLSHWENKDQFCQHYGISLQEWKKELNDIHKVLKFELKNWQGGF